MLVHCGGWMTSQMAMWCVSPFLMRRLPPIVLLVYVHANANVCGALPVRYRRYRKMAIVVYVFLTPSKMLELSTFFSTSVYSSTKGIFR